MNGSSSKAGEAVNTDRDDLFDPSSDERDGK